MPQVLANLVEDRQPVDEKRNADSDQRANHAFDRVVQGTGLTSTYNNEDEHNHCDGQTALFFESDDQHHQRQGHDSDQDVVAQGIRPHLHLLMEDGYK